MNLLQQFYSLVKLIVHKVEVESNFIFNYRKFSLSAGKEDLRRQLCTPSLSFSHRSTASSRWGCHRSRSAHPQWSSPRGRRPSCSRTSPGPCRAPRWSWSQRGCAHWATGFRPLPRDNAPSDNNYDEMLSNLDTFSLPELLCRKVFYPEKSILGSNLSWKQTRLAGRQKIDMR